MLSVLAGQAVRRTTRALFVVSLLAALAYYVCVTRNWPLMQDSGVMHYVIFLMHHGFQPYRDITDNNLPGSYLLEQAAMWLFGGGDLCWRFYDFFLLLTLTTSLIVIALPVDWLAGLFAGGLFALQHGSDGVWFAAEREQEMTVLLAAACACLFLSVRHGKPWLVAFFGFLAGMAASIKPTLAPFPVLALFYLFFVLRRRGTSPVPYLTWGLAGLGLACALSVGFLLRHGTLPEFFFITRLVTPVYAGLNDPGRRFLVLNAIPWLLLPLFALGAVAGLLRRRGNWHWEYGVLLLAVALGLLSYFAQGKGFPYHRYLFLPFGLLLAGLELFPRADWPLWLRACGGAALLYAALAVIPANIRAIHDVPATDAITPAMEADLRDLGGARLGGEVQCFDMILGCLNALYHLQLVENTGFTGDMLLFTRHANPATAYYETLFTRRQQAHPASVLVVTNEDFGEPNSFHRLSLWPEFASYLAANYTLVVTRSFPRQGKRRNEPSASPDTALAYRIYLRKGLAFPGDLPLKTREGQSLGEATHAVTEGK